MSGFISTLSYNTLQHILPQQPVATDTYLVPEEFSLPFPDIIKPNCDIPKTHLEKLSKWIGSENPISWDEFMAYWHAFTNHPIIQTIKYFKNEVICIRYKNGDFIREYGEACLPIINQYRASFPHKKDTDILRAIIRRDDELFRPPYTRSWIRSYYKKNWDFERLKPALEFVVGCYDPYPNPHLTDKVPEDTETYKKWCPKVNNE